MAKPNEIRFTGAQGEELSARLDLPSGPIRAYAIFAHCFTCSKNIIAAKHISGRLSSEGVAVLRFDFTGLGSSGGEFANTNFSSNITDLLKAADFLRENYEAPSLIIGHSLGGAAVLAAAGDIPEVKAVVSIGAPADAAHVTHMFDAVRGEIEETGEAKVMLEGRPFTIRKQFLDDLEASAVLKRVSSMRGKALLVLHSPIDQTVGIENAEMIFKAAKHPKSFVSLDDAHHLLLKKKDAAYAAQVISGWAERYIGNIQAAVAPSEADVTVRETGIGKFQNTIEVQGKHRLIADEPSDVGGFDSGPAPYDFVAAGLGACTSMTLRMYASFKKLDLGRVTVHVDHKKVHAEDCEACAEELAGKGGKIDQFERRIEVEGDVTPELEAKLLQIADKCPVHKTLEASASVVTRVVHAG